MQGVKKLYVSHLFHSLILTFLYLTSNAYVYVKLLIISLFSKTKKDLVYEYTETERDIPEVSCPRGTAIHIDVATKFIKRKSRNFFSQE